MRFDAGQGPLVSFTGGLFSATAWIGQCEEEVLIAGGPLQQKRASDPDSMRRGDLARASSLSESPKQCDRPRPDPVGLCLCEALYHEVDLEFCARGNLSYLEIVEAWRKEFAPTFVEKTLAARGRGGALNMNREEAEEFLEGRRKCAVLLERLARLLPIVEVSRA